MPATPNTGAMPNMTNNTNTGTMPNMMAKPNTGMMPDMMAKPNTGMMPNMTAKPNMGMMPDMTAKPNMGMMPNMTAKPNMGMTTWSGDKPRKTDAEIAKNYLNEKELDALNRIVTAYLEFAELQALNRQPMYMRDWIAKLEDFLRLSGREILTHTGKISHEQAIQKAELEYEKYRQRQLAEPSQVEKDFEKAVKKLPKAKKGD